MSDKTGVLIEDLYDQNKLTLELLHTLVENQQRDQELVAQIPQIKDDVAAIKTVVKVHTKQLKHIEQTLAANDMPVRA